MLLSLDIERIEALADGAPFGEVGAYERVIGRAKGEVDPLDPANKGIALIDKAPRNARGKVEYATDIFILGPRIPPAATGGSSTRSTTAAARCCSATSPTARRA